MFGRLEFAWACPGPLVWFDVPDDDWTVAAILECASCEYWIVTGHINDAAHSRTEVIREGLAS